MEGQYPIKPYKKPKGTSTLTHKITAKFGKVIEVFFDEANPEIVTFNFKSKNDKMKDTFQLSIEEVLSLRQTLTHCEKMIEKTKD